MLTDPPTYSELRARRRTFLDDQADQRAEDDLLWEEAQREVLGPLSPSPADGLSLLRDGEVGRGTGKAGGKGLDRLRDPFGPNP